MWCSEDGWRVPDQSSKYANTTDQWAGACIYHQAQIAMGIFILCFVPVGYFIMEAFFQTLVKTKLRQNSIQQWIRVITSIALAITCWVEASFAIRDYFKDGDIELSSLVSPVVFSLVPVASIWFQLFESNFIIGGSGIVLFLNIISAILFFPTSITAGHFFTKRDYIHDISQYQRALNFCLLEFGLTILVCLMQILPDITNKERKDPAAWEEGATLFSRLNFGWFGKLVSLATQKTVTVEDLPEIPYYLMGSTCHSDFVNSLKAEKEKPFLIKEVKQRGQKKKEVKSEKSKEKSEEKKLLENEEDGKNNGSKKLPRIIDLPKAGFRCMQKSILKVLAKAYWRPFVVAGLFKLGHDLMAFALPQILKLFIGWIDDKESAKQWGFIYALGLFVVPGIQTILLHQYFWTGTANGLIMKNSLTAELYRKSLVLSSRARKMMTHGEIVNLMAVDAQKFQEISTYLHMIWSAPLQISLSLYFLYRELGSAIFTGVAIMIILIPINAFVGKKIGTFMREIMMLKDKRLKVISEMLNSMKVVKLYAWEKFFSKWITDVRKSELDAIWRKAKVGIWMAISWSVSPFMVTLAAFATYILIDPEENILTPQKAFVSITYFNLLRFPMQMLPMMLMQLFELMVAVTRLQNFINLPETEKRETSGDEIHGSIKVKNGHFKWDLDSSENTLHDINLHVKPGELVAIVGHIGSGKSSLLSAFLNEMETVDETGKLAKDDAVEMLGSIGYVPQEAWLQNATLEENIIFGNDKKSSYYKQCIDAAALKSDLEILPSGDQTEIGEKGINLSGGQKQRVSLARAAYASPDILLFDDPLSAVDPHVAKEIFEKLISEKSLMKDKTRVLVTHATQFLPRCDRVILVAKGRIIDQGVYQDVFDNNPAFHPILKTAVEAEKSDYETVQSSTSDQSVKSSDSKEKKMTSGKLIASEAMKEGTVDAEVFKNYFNHFGWKSVIIILCLNITRFCLWMGENLWLASWSDDSKTLQSNLNMGNQNSSNSTGNIEHPTDEYEDIIPVKTRLSVYSVLGLSQAIFVVSQSLFAAKAGIRAGKRLHMDLIDALVQFPISFYDKTPTGRILNRVGKDIETVDAPLIRSLEMWTFCGFRVLFGCISICVGSPYYLIALPPFFWLYWKIQRIFVSTTRQLKRMESVSKSPIYAHFGESINGASTIRAYDHKGRFIDRNAELIDANSQANYYGSVIAYRWLAVRLEFLSHTLVLIASIIFCLVRESESTTAGKVGFALSNAVMMSQTLNWFVRQTSDVETHIVSVERLSEYSNDRETFPYEKRTDDDDQVLADSWPQKGKLELKNFSLVYKKDNPPALDNLELHIENGQKVGICGRTGSGKSSLALSLFRLFEPEEKSQYILDGVDCMRIDLERLRKTLTIIPQEPILFSSTLRRNLDPFDQFSDNEIHETLRLAHLSRFVNEELEKGLDHEVSEGGTNLSAGQRQLICLARALLRKTKILILDEATASVDSETDQLVQKTIRNEFKDCTILAVAHRIDTIDDYDKILVLDKGQIIEFDSPENLKTREDGVYRSMYDAAMGNKKDQ